MRIKFFRKLLVIWMIVWLPAAGALAAVMPLAAWSSAASSSTALLADDEDVALMPCHGKSAAQTLGSGQGCSHCLLCHLAGAMVTPEMPIIPTLTPTHIFSAAPQVAPSSFVPELISPPPRSLAK